MTSDKPPALGTHSIHFPKRNYLVGLMPYSTRCLASFLYVLPFHGCPWLRLFLDSDKSRKAVSEVLNTQSRNSNNYTRTVLKAWFILSTALTTYLSCSTLCLLLQLHLFFLERRKEGRSGGRGRKVEEVKEGGMGGRRKGNWERNALNSILSPLVMTSQSFILF